MELGKTIVLGIGLFLFGSLWLGSRENLISHSETENQATTPQRQFSLSPIRKQTASVETSQRPVPADNYWPNERDSGLVLSRQYRQADESVYDEYATYSYIRPRDIGTENTYSYRVTGEDCDGNFLQGMVNTRGRYGSGYLRTESQEFISITTEWNDDGNLLGFDDQDNSYTLQTNPVR